MHQHSGLCGSPSFALRAATVSGPPAAATGSEPQGRAPGADRPPATGAPRHGAHSPAWLSVPAVVIVIAAIQLTLPPTVTLGPLWLIPAVELVGIPLGMAIRRWPRLDGTWRTERSLDRSMAAYLGFLVMASALNALLLLSTLLSSSEDSAVRLLFAGFAVLAINVLTFGLIYWWIDGGGPRVRLAGEVTRWDFQYPQQASGQTWAPTMIDYFFTAYTNIIAFSPTDTMPLTHRVKLLFVLQSSISVVTILVTVSRAINMIPLK